jgi:nicotinate-nucleotide pyrophosphorylase (carboxylating)
MLSSSLIDPIVKIALKEDVGARDITSLAIIPKNLQIKADIEFKQKGVLCGIGAAERVFRLIDGDVRFLPTAKDGEVIEKNREVAYLEGSAVSILTAERTALNFLGRLSGIATRTRDFVEKIKGTSAKILDTRKTTPGLRVLEKYAVCIGGGHNHRFGLFDQALIKDNHLRILRKKALVDIVAEVKSKVLKKTIVGVEVKNLSELREALKSKADYILLDNMSVETVLEAVILRKKMASKIELEVSGGIHLENVLAYAQTGVERISIGALTHSAPCADISLNIVA